LIAGCPSRIVLPSITSIDAGTSKLRSARRVAVTTTGSSVAGAGSLCACARLARAPVPSNIQHCGRVIMGWGNARVA